MSILSKLPDLVDDDLTNLLANAERLEQEGTNAQRKAAGEMLPVIRAEVSARKAAKPVAKARRAAKPR